MKGNADCRMERSVAGAVGWLWDHLHPPARPRPLLTVVERVVLAPRQSLVLIEAEGRKLLVATSADCAPTFYPLDEPGTQVWREYHQRRAIELKESVC